MDVNDKLLPPSTPSLKEYTERFKYDAEEYLCALILTL